MTRRLLHKLNSFLDIRLAIKHLEYLRNLCRGQNCSPSRMPQARSIFKSEAFCRLWALNTHTTDSV